MIAAVLNGQLVQAKFSGQLAEYRATGIVHVIPAKAVVLPDQAGDGRVGHERPSHTFTQATNRPFPETTFSVSLIPSVEPSQLNPILVSMKASSRLSGFHEIGIAAKDAQDLRGNSLIVRHPNREEGPVWLACSPDRSPAISLWIHRGGPVMRYALRAPKSQS